MKRCLLIQRDYGQLGNRLHTHANALAWCIENQANLVNLSFKEFKKKWKGALGIHTHDNIAQAINNSIPAAKSGVTWIDSTVTGMGRGP